METNSPESWRPAPGLYEGFYGVSDQGRVQSLPRRVRRGNGASCWYPGRVLTPAVSGPGYPFVVLSARSAEQRFSVHRLVMLVFEPRADADQMMVNHKNGIKTDPRRCNLEWVTRSENSKHSFHVLGQVSPSKGLFGSAHPGAVEIERVSRDGDVVRFGSLVEAAAATDATPVGICMAASGRQKSHRGFSWRYVGEA